MNLFRTRNTDDILNHAKKIYKKHAKVAQNRQNTLKGAFHHGIPATH